ncbi:DNA repair protein rad18 [Ascosphaera apis ARSEF 7405]|uniref:Postreplication repair E3 ubiquitin-protein ligase RAD18 n=1 Tax=Ascosphaera apis ARSEF 7405 TaxID=392613 RepID=A0A167WMY5_9EURO|nr:DNA repair protein rad18 [Ascosphaera apis ARSEF 7405]
MADPAFDIPDTTDWLPTPLSKLSALEAALRCQVCKDFFTNPVITSCSHTFCSLCIRRCLSAEGKCPACRASDQPTRLRCNWAMQEAVDGWVQARKDVLDAAREVGKPKVERVQDGLSPGIKRALEDEKPDEPVADIPDGKKRLRSSTRARSVTYAYEETSTQLETSLSKDETYIPDDVEEVSSISASNLPPPVTEPDDGLVSCPICTRRMKPTLVFSHLDRCPGPPSQNQSSTTLPSPKRTPFAFQSTTRPSPSSLERLPSLNYTLMNDRELRRKLSALGISSTGPRQLLQRRHTEWINLWNANCDSRHPKTKRELLQELDLWERTQGASSSSSTNGYGNGNGVNGKVDVARKDFDKENWGRGHQDTFRDLIEQARRGRNQKKEEEQTAQEADKVEVVDPMSLDATPAPQTPRKNQNTASEPIEVDTPRASETHQPPPSIPTPIPNPQARFANPSQNDGLPTTAGTAAYRPPYQQQPTTLPTPMSFAQSVDPIESSSPQQPLDQTQPSSSSDHQTLPGNPSYGDVAIPGAVRHQDEQQQEQTQNGVPTITPITFAQSVDPIEPDAPDFSEGNVQPQDDGTVDRVPDTPPVAENSGEGEGDAAAQGKEKGSSAGHGARGPVNKRRSRRRSARRT